MITIEQIAAAETVAEQAAGELAEVEKEFARGAVTARTHGRLYDARTASEHAAVRLSLLRKDYDAQEAARLARVAAGRDAAKAMESTSRLLLAGREGALAAVAQARTALGEALARLAEYDKAVRAASADLQARGLRAADDGANGSRLDGGLHLGGELWLRVDGPSLMGSVLASVVSEVQPRHPLARGAQFTLGSIAAVAGRDDLLARLPTTRRKAA